MESLEFNKAAFALLSTCLFVMGIGIFSDSVFTKHHLEKAGYALPDTAPAGGGEAKEAPKALPIGELMAKADAKRGEAGVGQCKACHTFDEGGKNGIGPNLYGVVDRKIASHEGFTYSGALQGKEKTDDKWTYEHLFSFVTNPRGYANGTKMAFAGVKDPAKLADIVAYLRTLSKNPVPLPK